MADGGGGDRRAARRLELAQGGGVERVDRRHRRAVEGRIEFAPFPRRDDRAGREAERVEKRPDLHRIGREHLAEQRDRRAPVPGLARGGDGAVLRLTAGDLQHRAGEHVLGLGMRRHAEARNVDPDDPHPVDLAGQEPQRHAGGGRDAEIDDHHRVVERRIGGLAHRVADVLEQLAGDERLGVERHVADGPPRAVEMRGEGQPVDAAGRARQDRGGAAHPQAHPQRPEGRAHALRLVVRAGRVVALQGVQGLAHAGGFRRPGHRLLAGMAAEPVLARRLQVDRGIDGFSGAQRLEVEGGAHGHTAS